MALVLLMLRLRERVVHLMQELVATTAEFEAVFAVAFVERHGRLLSVNAAAMTRDFAANVRLELALHRLHQFAAKVTRGDSPAVDLPLNAHLPTSFTLRR